MNRTAILTFVAVAASLGCNNTELRARLEKSEKRLAELEEEQRDDAEDKVAAAKGSRDVDDLPVQSSFGSAPPVSLRVRRGPPQHFAWYTPPFGCPARNRIALLNNNVPKYDAIVSIDGVEMQIRSAAGVVRLPGTMRSILLKGRNAYACAEGDGEHMISVTGVSRRFGDVELLEAVSVPVYIGDNSARWGGVSVDIGMLLLYK